MRQNRLLSGGKRCLILVVVFIVGSTLSAFAADPTPPPNSGTILNSIEQKQPPAQPKNNVNIEVSGQQQAVPEPSVGPRMKVNGFHITGQSLYREDKLQELVKDEVGKELTLGELKNAAGRIAQYLRDQGFVVASAYVPAQEMIDGIVEIAVMPGKYSGVALRNHSKLSDAVAARLVSNIKSGDYVKRSQLERTLLLLSDTGGISIKAVLTPGKAAGTTELVVDINDADRLTGELAVNNYGNRYTGSDPRNLDLSLNNASGLGDVLSVSGSYTGDGMNNFSMNYMVPYGSQGWRLGANYSRLHYTLGEEYAPLLGHGRTETGGVYGQYPIVRSRSFDLYGQIGMATRRLVDDIDAFDSSNQRKTNFVTVGLSGVSRDSRSVSSFGLNVASGRLHFTGGQDVYGDSWQSVDAQGAQTGGSYTKANVSFNRLQSVSDRLNFYLLFTGQLASCNLDSSEQLYLGGANGVRAYAQGEAPGDEGYVITGELRYNLPTPRLQLAAFIDGGHVDGSKSGWVGGDSSRTLSGAGLGLIVSSRNEYSIRADYAWKLSSSPDTTETPNKHGRWWLTGVRYF
ncbi:MAG TPA: ShlB/FhaC/HecB family hemolysin secretion/activation protein [Negativicutes bacterium]|jgi:hemolysin activation/secretion protein